MVQTKWLRKKIEQLLAPVSGILIDIYRILFSSGQDSVKAATGFHIWQLLLIILGVLILIG